MNIIVKVLGAMFLLLLCAMIAQFFSSITLKPNLADWEIMFMPYCALVVIILAIYGIAGFIQWLIKY